MGQSVCEALTEPHTFTLRGSKATHFKQLGNCDVHDEHLFRIVKFWCSRRAQSLAFSRIWTSSFASSRRISRQSYRVQWWSVRMKAGKCDAELVEEALSQRNVEHVAKEWASREQSAAAQTYRGILA